MFVIGKTWSCASRFLGVQLETYAVVVPMASGDLGPFENLNGVLERLETSLAVRSRSRR